MITQVKLVAVGHIDTDRPANDTLVCDPGWADTWHEGAQNSMDALPVEEVDYPTLFPLHDAYEQGVMDRIMGVPSQSLQPEYKKNVGERMAYIAGYCTSRLLTDRQIAAELEELQEGMEDDLYHSRGQW
jgi:hypothetical protein